MGTAEPAGSRKLDERLRQVNFLSGGFSQPNPPALEDCTLYSFSHPQREIQCDMASPHSNVRSPAMADSATGWAGSPDPIKIGWLGSALDGPDGGYNKIHRMAFDEALEQGLLDRPVEFVIHAEHGLPRGSARNTADGFRYLVDQGCIGIAGAYSSDNAIVAAPLANELKVPLISWAGTERLAGDYCFRLGNGDCGGDAALCASWLAR